MLESFYVPGYREYDRQQGSGNNRRSIEGKKIGCNKCVGFCRFEEHPGFLTKELRKQHDCINKNCYYYLPRSKEPTMATVSFEVEVF